MYAPLTSFGMNRYGAPTAVGVFRSSPVLTNVNDAGIVARDTSHPVKTILDKSAPNKFAPVKSRFGPTMYPPDAAVVAYRYPAGRMGVVGLAPYVAESRPDRIFISVALLIFAPVKSVPEISVFVKFAFCKFTRGPTTYPPLSDDVMRRYGAVNITLAGVALIMRPVRVFVKFAFEKFTPSTFVNEISAPDKSAPLKSIPGPIM